MSAKPFKLALIGTDTSHSSELPGRMQDPARPPEEHVEGLFVTRAFPFMTPFTNETVQKNRKNYLESIGVTVCDSFESAVEDCDGIMLEINDPSYHLEYFRKCAELGKPVFLDKPFADTFDNARKICALAKAKEVRLFSSSALRYDPSFTQGLENCDFTPTSAVVWGPMGNAAAGSSVIWYGCHSFEMLERVMGRGATGVHVHSGPEREVCVVDYSDGRHGVVELSRTGGGYGALLRNNEGKASLIPAGNSSAFYTALVKKIKAFMEGEDVLAMEDMMEVMSMLEAAARSSASGRPEYVFAPGLLLDRYLEKIRSGRTV
ncbi:MAG: Gfo/Idh/MocA family oxidoreductase [Lentisphaeria bacterium]|nr:Gfo/Idh/MocA family oxidoreductase [Lentisphaeria bacterium]